MSGEPQATLAQRKAYERQSLDDYITDVALNRTMGELFQTRVSAPDARSAFVANTICNAVLDMDIGLISEIVKRIDGMAPAKGDVDGFSNIFSDAINDVLEYRQSDQMVIHEYDPPILALAKATMAVSVSRPGSNMQARKDRQKAVAMIMDRVEGRRDEPAKKDRQIEYAAPDWMGLPEGGTSERGEER